MINFDFIMFLIDIMNSVINRLLLKLFHFALIAGKVNKGQIPIPSQPGVLASLPVALNPSIQARSSSSAFPSSSSVYNTSVYNNQMNNKAGFEAPVGAEVVPSSSSTGPVEPVKKVRVY